MYAIGISEHLYKCFLSNKNLPFLKHLTIHFEQDNKKLFDLVNQQEIDFAYNTAIASKDPYQLGLAANILYNKKDTKRAKAVLEQLMSIQLENGSWESTNKGRSAPGSSGKALKIETAALALSALLARFFSPIWAGFGKSIKARNRC